MGYTNKYSSVASCVRSIRKHVTRNNIAAVCTTNNKTYFFVKHKICVDYRQRLGQVVKVINIHIPVYNGCTYCKAIGSNVCCNPGYC